MSAGRGPILSLPPVARRRLLVATLGLVTSWTALLWLLPTKVVPTPPADVAAASGIGVFVVLLSLGLFWLSQHKHPAAKFAHGAARGTGRLVWAGVGGIVLAAAWLWAVAALGIAVAGGGLAALLGERVPAPDVIGLSVLPVRLATDPSGLFGPGAQALGVGLVVTLGSLSLLGFAVASRHGRLKKASPRGASGELRDQLLPNLRAHGIRGSRPEFWDLPHHLRPRMVPARRRPDGLLVPLGGPIDQPTTRRVVSATERFSDRLGKRLLARRYPRRALALTHNEHRTALAFARKHPLAALRLVLRAALRMPGRVIGRLALSLSSRLSARLHPLPATSLLLGEVRTRHFLWDRRWTVVTRPATHSCIVGPSRVGKGISAMLPPLLAASGPDDLGWPGPMVASSAKGDLLLPTLEWRKSLGQVMVWSPLGIADLGANIASVISSNLTGWNPAADAVDADAAMRIASLFVPDLGPSAAGNASYFASRAAQVLGPLLRAANLRKRGMNMVVANVADMALGQGSDAFNGATLLLTNSGDPNDLALIGLLKMADGAAPDERSGIIGTASRAIKAFGDARAASASGASSVVGGPALPLFDLAQFLSGPNTIFVVAPADPADAILTRPVVSAFLGRIQAAAGVLARQSPGGTLAKPLLMLLDECSVVGGLADLPDQLAVAAGLGIIIRHAWQDLAQMKAALGDKHSSAVTNSQALMLFPGSTDPEVLSLATKLTGTSNIESHTLTLAPDSADPSHAVGEQATSILAEAAMRQLRVDEILLICDTRPPLVVRQVAYFRHPQMAIRATPKPARTSLARRVVRGFAAPPRAVATWVLPHK